MELIFERGDRAAPAGHALIYFVADTGAVLATYATVPPIPFDLTKYMPPFLSGALGGMELGGDAVATPMPPVPEEVESTEYLQALATRRQDDLVFAGATTLNNPMQVAQDAAQACQLYGQLYNQAPSPQVSLPQAEPVDFNALRYANMSEREQLDELTVLTGRLRDSLSGNTPDLELESQMRQLADLLPAKYRGSALVNAAVTPGERGQKLAALHLERSYKLHNEEYLDLERIDREIAAIGD